MLGKRISHNIADTLESGCIKLADADIASRKYSIHIPHYA